MTEEFGKDIEKLETRIKENPDDLESMLKLGKTYFVCSRFDDAITIYQRVLLADADNVSGFYNLGMAYQAKKDSAKAIEMFRAVLKLDPDNTSAQEALDRMINFTPGG